MNPQLYDLLNFVAMSVFILGFVALLIRMISKNISIDFVGLKIGISG